MKDTVRQFLNFSILDCYVYFKEGSLNRSHKKNRKRSINHYLKNHLVKKLNIGCGSNLLSGWLNTDLNVTEEEVVYLDAGEVFPFDDNTFDYVFSEHLFEHLTPTQQVNFLKESRRVLKESGVLRIATPDLEFLINLYQENNSSENTKYLNWAIHQSKALKDLPLEAHGNQISYTYVINNFFRAWGHQMIHNYESLSSLANECGLSLLGRNEIGTSEFSHLQNVERHGEIIPAPFNEKETMIIEFIK